MKMVADVFQKEIVKLFDMLKSIKRDKVILLMSCFREFVIWIPNN